MKVITDSLIGEPVDAIAAFVYEVVVAAASCAVGSVSQLLPISVYAFCHSPSPWGLGKAHT